MMNGKHPVYMPRGQRILITGGAGFIGTALAERLVEENEVVILDQCFENTPLSYTDLQDSPRVQCVKGDILDTALVQDLVLSVDSLIHLAAVVGVRNVLARARRTIQVNFNGTSSLLAATEQHPGLKRFVYFSTSEVFGANSFRVHEGVYSSIGSVTEARWSYSISKLAGEHLLHCYHREFGLPSVIVRPFNVFGPRRLGDHAMLRFIAQAQAGQPLEIHGDGSQIRSWCYIDDFVDAIVASLACEGAVGEDFNIGNPRNTLTIYDLAKTVVRLLDSSSDIHFVEVGFSDIDIRVPQTEKARRVLGFEPRVELEEGVIRTAEWYAANLGRSLVSV
jgi:nucleoside-diphosphate-sugar epimerase